MNKNYLQLLIILLSFFLFPSCSEKDVSQNVIPEDMFIQFYADYMIVQEEISLNSLDSLQGKHRYDSLYKQYDLTPERVLQTREEYNKDLMKWQAVYEKVILRIDSLQQDETNKNKNKP
ncbi:MAG: DUF4296 domain-containing protein [Ignavibacteriales bacterium]|nr:DUF4296 domain-containing protein [Ignavibacteriales bacterium]